MRGTPRISRHSCPRRGIIPAYAGNTSVDSAASKKARDHPRVCGEHLAAFDAFVLSLGSSPRMRGTHHGVAVRGAEPGIIPAYAGNTLVLVAVAELSWDHPRVCGEHGRADH